MPSAWATAAPSLSDNQPDTTLARASTCYGYRPIACPNPSLPCLCWLWCAADHGWLTLLWHILGPSQCSTPSQLLNLSAWFLVAGWWGAAATRHQCLWNEVKREVSPQPDPFVFIHNHSYCSFAFIYWDAALKEWPTLLGVVHIRLILLYNDILICTMWTVAYRWGLCHRNACGML